MTHSYARILTVFAALVVALTMATGGVAALETTDAANDSNVVGSDLADGVTVNNFEANGSDYSILELKTPSTNTTDALTVSISAENNTHASYDTLSSSYSTTTGVDTTGDSTTDSDLHVFNISHDDLETVPVQANGQTPITVDVTYEYTDGSSNTGNASLSIDATLNATGERTVLYVTDDNLDDDDRGGAVTKETTEAGTLGGLLGDENTTTYTLDDSVAVDGSNTTVTVYMNGGMADSFEDAVDEDTESGDLVLTQTTLVGDSVAPTFNAESNSDLIGDDQAYAVYDSSSDSIVYELGGNASDSNELSVYAANAAAGDLEDDTVDSQSLFDAYQSADLGIMDAFSAFGINGLGISLGFEQLVFGG